MARATQRLRRYLEDELGDCRGEDVDRRLEELESIRSALGPEQLDAELAVCAALASETRYRVVRALVAAREELCVCELHALVDVTESGLSHALSELADAGLVASRQDGRWKQYRATNRAIALATVLEGSVGAADDGDPTVGAPEDVGAEGCCDE